MPTPNFSTNPNLTTEHPVRFYKIVAVSFLLLTLILLGVIIFMSSKRATITILSKPEVVEINSVFSVSKSGEDGISGFVTSTVLNIEKSFSPTGDTEVPGKATGKVVVYNDTDASQTLVATTRLLSKDGVLFRLKDKITVPAKGNVEAEVYSDKEGKENNIEPASFTIPGLNEEKQKVIYAKSVEPMTGGVATLGAISAEDLKQAEDILVEEIKAKSAETFVGGEGENVLISVVQHTFDADKEIGEQVSEFKGHIQGTVLAVFYNKNELLTRSRDLLLKKSIGETEIIEPGQESPVAVLENYDLAQNTAELKVFYSGLAKLNADSKQLQKEMFFDKNIEDVRRYLLALDHVNSVEVEFKPVWIQTVPPVADHVRIVIKQIQ